MKLQRLSRQSRLVCLLAFFLTSNQGFLLINMLFLSCISVAQPVIQPFLTLPMSRTVSFSLDRVHLFLNKQSARSMRNWSASVHGYLHVFWATDWMSVGSMLRVADFAVFLQSRRLWLRDMEDTCIIALAVLSYFVTLCHERAIPVNLSPCYHQRDLQNGPKAAPRTWLVRKLIFANQKLCRLELPKISRQQMKSRTSTWGRDAQIVFRTRRDLLRTKHVS